MSSVRQSPSSTTNHYKSRLSRIKPWLLKKFAIVNVSSAPKMGQFTSRRKEDTVENDATTKGTTSSVPARSRSAPVPDILMAKYAAVMRERGIVPDVFLVCETLSSKYVDEDGDEANEFYAEQTVQGRPQRRLCRIVKNLRPKGKEPYSIPRLSPDVPVVMLEMKAN